MNFDFQVNDYLLAWYLLYGASLSKEIDKFRRSLFSKYRKEYNLCYRDKEEIIKYGKDYIPNDDTLYNATFLSDLYKAIKKETIRYKTQISKQWDNDHIKMNKALTAVIRFELFDTVNIYVVHPRLEIVESSKDDRAMIIGSDEKRHNTIISMLLVLFKDILGDYPKEYQEIVDSIIELGVINEIGNVITNRVSDDLANPMLSIIKNQIYPFWLMYLGYVDKNSILNKMIVDKVGFDLDKYPIDKNIRKLDLKKFINFCIKNNRHILKLNNILVMEKEEDIEVI